MAWAYQPMFRALRPESPHNWKSHRTASQAHAAFHPYTHLFMPRTTTKQSLSVPMPDAQRTLHASTHVADLSESVTAPAKRVDAAVDESLSSLGLPQNLVDAMKYSALGPGKRARPLLCWHSFVAVAPQGADPSACLPAAAVMPQIKAGKLKALAVATEKRSPVLPDLPTLREAGIENVFADAWMGFVVPARTPAAIVKRLRDEIGLVLADREVREKLRAQYMDVVANSPAEFRAVMNADMERWKPVIEKNHIRLD